MLTKIIQYSIVNVILKNGLLLSKLYLLNYLDLGFYFGYLDKNL